jgi:hypothetical protein
MNRAALINTALETVGIDTRRFSLNWVSAAEATRFVKLIKEFTGQIAELGPLGESEGIAPDELRRGTEAARMALQGSKIRMAFARQAKQIKQEGTYGKFPDKDKILTALKDEINLYETFIYLREKERSSKELAGLLNLPEDKILAMVETLKKKNIWEGEIKIKD